MRVDRAVKELGARLGRSPSVTEVAERLGDSVDDVLAAMEASLSYEALSLEADRGNGDGGGESLADSVGEDEDRYDLVEYGASIEPALKALGERDRLILRLRFVDDLT